MRIVVVEDEVLVRKGILTGIPWEEHGIRVVGEAGDGQSGLDLILAEKPDMVLSDIQMPIMDGLQMIRRVLQELPDTAIMILSVREDFRSVQEALRLGVLDYVHKLTMSPEELLDSVLKVKRSKQVPGIPVRKALYPVSVTGRNGMEEWLAGGNSQEWEAVARSSAPYVVGKIRMRGKPIDGGSVRLLAGDFPLIRQAIIREAREEGDYWLWLSGVAEDGKLQEIAQFLKSVCARSPGGGDMAVGLSRIFEDRNDRTAAAKQADEALDHYFFHKGFGEVHVWTEAPASSISGGNSFCPSSRLKQYLTLLELQDEEKARESFDQLFPESANLELPPQQIRDGTTQWLSGVLLLLNEWGASFQDTLFEQSPFEKLSCLATYPDIRDWCFRLHVVARDVLGQLRSVQHRTEIRQSIDYIRSMYHKPLRVQDVASAVHLSENYFSYLFTKNTGKTFVQFLQETRIEKAKELLRKEEASWFVIGEQVGFDNPKYFAKIFKRYTQQTPAQYRKI